MKPHTFKIYPFRKNKSVFDKTVWWSVMYFETKKEMRSATVKKKCGVCKSDFIKTSDHAGLTHSHAYRQMVDEFGQVQKPKVKGELGIIFIQKENSGGGVVAHELFHATMYTAMRFTSVLNFDSGNFTQADERLAYINGNLHNGYWTHMTEREV